MKLTPGDRVALLASIGGSQGLTTAWCALQNGASLWPYPVMDKGAEGLGDWIAASAISVYISSPSLFRHFIKSLREGAILSSLRIAKLGAEQATSEDFAAFQKHFPEDAIFVHTLGCSEAGNIAALRLS